MRATAVDAPDLLPNGETDIFELRRNGASLTAVVRSLLEPATSLEVVFSSYCALLEADEGDFAGYWGNGQLDSNHNVYEIVEGGFLSAMRTGSVVLFITPHLPGVREWFIATSGTCLSVLADTTPQVRVTRQA